MLLDDTEPAALPDQRCVVCRLLHRKMSVPPCVCRALFRCFISHAISCEIHVTLLFVTRCGFGVFRAELGVDVIQFGYFQTAFSLFQAIGGPLLGTVIDTHGARAGLQIAQFGAALSYLSLGMATTIPALFASRIFSLLMHTMHCCQTYVATISLPDSRATAMGRLTVSCASACCCVCARGL